MAEALQYICSSCGHTVQAWSDANPYYIDESGCKQYAYHPDFEGLARCIGVDSPHICLACGEGFRVDSEAPTDECPKCGSDNFVGTFELNEQRCPYCKKGVFAVDPTFCIIS